MAKKSMILKQQAEPKFSTRRYNRCKICGRPHAYLRDYGICVSASASWLTRARSPASRRRLGKSRSAMLRCGGSTYTKYAFAAAPCLTKRSSPIRTVPGNRLPAGPGPGN